MHLDVGRLQVMANDPSFARRFECLGNLLRYREGFIDRDRSLGDPISQGWPLDQLQHKCLGQIG